VDFSCTRGAGFVSPTGNTACVVFTRASGLYDALTVRCDLRDHTYTTPPKPQSCGTDSGQTIELGDSARFLCAGDTILDHVGTRNPYATDYTTWFDPTQNPAVGPLAGLGYGNSIKVDAITCTSTRSGVDCRNTATGVGFLIGMSSYRLTGRRPGR